MSTRFSNCAGERRVCRHTRLPTGHQVSERTPATRLPAVSWASHPVPGATSIPAVAPRPMRDPGA
jgi:hypothetical protein